MFVFPPRDSNVSERLSPSSERKSSPDKPVEIFSVLALKTILNITARGRIMFAAVFRWSPSFSANRILYRRRMRKEASGSGNTTPAGHMAQALLAGKRPSDSVLVQLRGRMVNKSIDLQFSRRRRLVLNMIYCFFLRRVRNYTMSQRSTHLFSWNTHAWNAAIP